jgi:hypothetical protein
VFICCNVCEKYFCAAILTSYNLTNGHSHRALGSIPESRGINLGKFWPLFEALLGVLSWVSQVFFKCVRKIKLNAVIPKIFITGFLDCPGNFTFCSKWLIINRYFLA